MPDPRFATVRLDTGPSIHSAEQGPVDGLPMILLHGWPDSWFSYSRVMPLLSPAIRVFAVDQRGYGVSHLAEGEVGMDAFADDVIAFLDALSIERGVLVGHSFGSFAEIRVSTLLLWGDHDALFSRNDQDRVVAAITGSRLIVYPDTGHCPNWERPERVASDINAFVDLL
jgi:pimeloyl-ACP methyl ester carboxylesterase